MVLKVSAMPELQPILEFDVNDCSIDSQLECEESLDFDGNASDNASDNESDANSKRNPFEPIHAVVRRQAPTFLLIEALIWCLCGYHSKDRVKQKQLYLNLCHGIEQYKIIGDSYKSDFLQPIRDRIVFKLTEALTNLGVLRCDGSIPRLPKSSYIANYSSRYKEEFDDLGLIEEGGFGIVKKVKHYFDNCNYAVKMIRFRFKNMSLFKTITREVELYATLSSHPNVVAYKTAWIEYWQLNDTKQSPTKLPPNENEIMVNTENINISNNVDDVSIRFEETSRSSIRIDKSASISKDVELSKQSDDEADCILDDDNSERSQLFSSSSLSSKTIARKKTISLSSSKSLSDSAIKYNHYCLKDDYEKVPNINDIENKDLNDPPMTCNQLDVVLYIQMELCGTNLRTWLRERNDKIFQKSDKSLTNNILVNIDCNQSLQIFRQVLKGVEFIHSRHLIHRDLKPQNILFSIDDQNKVKIGDFGLATLHNSLDNEEISLHSNKENATHSGDNHTRGLGTSIYAAPEQKVRSTYDHKADMFSLGIILFELFYPLATEMEKVKCVNDITNKRTLPQNLYKRWPIVADMILKLTNSDANLRPNANEVLNSYIFLSKEQQIIKRLEEKLFLTNKILERKEKDVSILKDIISIREEEIFKKDNEIARLKAYIASFADSTK